MLSQRPLSAEIIDYLIGRIQQDEQLEKRAGLKQRLLHFAPAFFTNGFLKQDDSKFYENTAVERGLESYYAWLVIVGYLDDMAVVRNESSYRKEMFYFLSLILTKTRKIRLVNCNLKGIDLSGADLSEVNLEGSDLEEASLNRTVIIHGILRNSDFNSANLAGAYLTGVNLEGANLKNATLFDTELSSANLSGADLSDAKFHGAFVNNVNFNGANFSNVHALEYNRLLEAKSLYNCKNLDPDLEAQLKAAKPSLFTEKSLQDEEE
jgi:uncharacterized protein YjbI with pentapeptide repeats